MARFSGSWRAVVLGRRVDLDKVLVYYATVIDKQLV
jgi:hypothetical protein